MGALRSCALVHLSLCSFPAAEALGPAASKFILMRTVFMRPVRRLGRFRDRPALQDLAPALRRRPPHQMGEFAKKFVHRMIQPPYPAEMRYRPAAKRA